ncbi:hypothetical protein LIA77_05715 [Sarocladium implicatum]|nr:hypothetical protein LIA77_05715 [Sarocladium implicatum]
MTLETPGSEVSVRKKNYLVGTPPRGYARGKSTASVAFFSLLRVPNRRLTHQRDAASGGTPSHFLKPQWHHMISIFRHGGMTRFIPILGTIARNWIPAMWQYSTNE